MENAEGLNPEIVENPDFAIVRRGYQPELVRRRLREAAGEIRRLNSVVSELSERLSRVEAASPDDLEASRVAEALGEEAVRVLQTAREAALDRIERADAEGAEIVDTARAAAAAIVEEGRDRGREVVQEAKAVRERILTDLARKRKAQRVEVEQLRTVRDRLLESLSICQEGLAEWIEELVQVVPQARSAAQRAGLLIAAEPEPTASEIEAEIETGRLMGLPLHGVPADPAPASAPELGQDSDEEAALGPDGAPGAFGDMQAETALTGAGAWHEPLVEGAEHGDDTGPETDSAPDSAGTVAPYDVEVESVVLLAEDADAEDVEVESVVLLAEDVEAEDVALHAEDVEAEDVEAEDVALHGEDADGCAFSVMGEDGDEPVVLIGDDAGESEEGVADLDGPADEGADELAATAASTSAASDADAIFARLRAVRQRSPAVAPELAGPEAPEEEAASVPLGAEPSETAIPDEAVPNSPATADDPEGGGADDDLVGAARSVAVGEMSRRLKRMVVDEQGELLDALRRLGVRALETGINTETGRYARAVRGPLEDFASDIDVSIDDIDLRAAGQAVVTTLVEPMRGRLTELAEDGDDIEELSAAVRAVCRESRSRLAEAAAAEAFAKGWPEPVA